MIKFFRKIRQNLLMENKTGKYLKYAVGEILLVMVGILLALQVNNWNEKQKNVKLEVHYLNRLLKDLELDLEDLGTVIISNTVNLVLAEDALLKLGADTTILRRDAPSEIAHKEATIIDQSVIYSGSIITDYSFRLESFGHQLTRLLQTRGFDLTQTTINDLLSTGKIEVIRNKNLRQKIQSYYAVMQSNIGNEEDLINRHRYYLQSVLNDAGIPPWSKLTLEEVKDITGVDKSLKTALYNIYEGTHISLRINYTNDGSLFKKIQQLKKEINAELDLL
ncbi:hypothetical protein JYB62_10195 [Algoriphagus lutimaris]|uniref:DUF6090 family protein n=1 Tax=Algoriphagus lutimaris TaxID=613197 RepID=UPI00196B9FD8|nr:DUF6090 family protein [Algoriphagus lutimaris]MBN3520374.1 hypothetical protein [Algoriphagus lutimaris]